MTQIIGCAAVLALFYPGVTAMLRIVEAFYRFVGLRFADADGVRIHTEGC